jgi:hypothetical protein
MWVLAMGIAIFRSVGVDDDPNALASVGVRRLQVSLIVAVRLSSGILGAVVAVAGIAPPARPGLVCAAALLVLLWSSLFAFRILRYGPSPATVYADVLVVVPLLLAHRWLVPAQIREVSAGTGWVDIVAGASVIVAQLGLRQPAGLAMAFLVTAAYVVGDGQMREAPIHFAVAALVSAGIVTLLHRAADTADAALVDAADRRYSAIVRVAVRADERDHQRHMHDTVLATLTMVHIGGIANDSVALRERAAADLAMIESLRAPPASGREPDLPTARLDLVLRFAAVRPPPGGPPLDVSVDIPPIELPADVAAAVAHSVAEALTNVARHAGTGAARLAGHAEGGGAFVVVSDGGVGFDVDAVPPHRRGIRESIVERMRAVGGSAAVRSRVGGGTRVVLRWPDV